MQIRQRLMTDAQYYRFCMTIPDLRVERTSEGDILIMPPPGAETSWRNSELTMQLGNWAQEDGRGLVFDSSVEYFLPSGAAYSPDASWVLRSRVDKLTRSEKRRFPHLCPDFVVELMSPLDHLSELKAKMREWIENGAQLGWLLDPDRRTGYFYRPGREPEQLATPERIDGEGPVAGFVLELARVWAEL
jgi:Uma2 family endonuclease